MTAPNLEFHLPANFRVSPLADGASGDARPAVLDAPLPEGDGGDARPVVLDAPLPAGDGGDERLGVLAAAYRAAGVVFAANVGGLSGRPAIGHFTVTIEPFEDVDPRTAALAIAEILSAGRAIHRAVKLVRLPCGPAVATEEVREVATVPEAAAGGSPPGEPAPAKETVAETAVELGQSQVFVKPAGCPGLVVLTMATLAVSDLGWYTRELALVAQSLRFT